MSERIDHAKEARRLLFSTGQFVEQDLGVAMASAQAHATLALAEQQRITNLLAMSESGRTTVNGARAALSAMYVGAVEDGTAHMQLRPNIAAALRIGDPDE